MSELVFLCFVPYISVRAFSVIFVHAADMQLRLAAAFCYYCIFFGSASVSLVEW